MQHHTSSCCCFPSSCTYFTCCTRHCLGLFVSKVAQLLVCTQTADSAFVSVDYVVLVRVWLLQQSKMNRLCHNNIGIHLETHLLN